MSDDEASVSAADPAAELERLRAENAALREQLAAGPVPERPRGWRRRWLSVTFAVIGAVALPLAVLTVWTRDTVLDTGQYVDTVDPLASNEDVQDAVAFRVSEAVAQAADFESIAEDVLPEDAQILAGPIAGGAERLVNEVVRELLASSQFQQLWREANRAAHERLVLVMTGEGSGAVQTSDGRVALQLGAVAEEALVRLDDQLGTNLADTVPAEDLDAEVVLVDSPDLADVQTQVRWFDNLSWFTLIVALLALVGAVVFAEQRRLGVRRVGVAVVVPMVLTLVAYGFARDQYLTALPADVHNPDAAAAVFDILTRFLQQALRALLVLGVLLLIGAWVVGPSAAAAKVRSWWDALLGRATGTGAREVGPAPRWVAAHERPLLVAVAVLGALVLVSWTRPTGMVVLVLAVLVLVALGAVRVVAEVGRRAEAAEALHDDGAAVAGDDLSHGERTGA